MEITNPLHVPYVCPACHSALDSSPGFYSCIPCHRTFPILLGIPDFRLRPDPYIGIEEDRAKGLKITQTAAGRDLRGLLEFYWLITPEVESERAKLFIESTLLADNRGRDILNWVEEGSKPISRDDNTFLDLGAGAGGLASAAAERFDKVVAVDRAFRWLAIARLRFLSEGRAIQLVCADAMELPFEKNSFDRIAADNVLEHNEGGQREIVCEAVRLLKPGDLLFASTPNRLAPLPDPHYRIWGLGLLPLKFRKTMVRWIRHKEYRHIRILSAGELRRLFFDARLRSIKIEPAQFGNETRSGFSGVKRILLEFHNWLWRFRLIRGLLLAISPVVWVQGRKLSEESATTNREDIVRT